jgi:hypothetical protein
MFCYRFYGSTAETFAAEPAVLREETEMIVRRTVHRVRPGHVGDFLELGKSTPDSPLAFATKRTYTASVGVEGTTVCHELELEDLTELDQTWAAR